MKTYEYTYDVLEPKWLEITVEVRITYYMCEPETWDCPASEEIEWEFVGWCACDQDGNETCGEDEPPYAYSESAITRYLMSVYADDIRSEIAEERADYLLRQADWKLEQQKYDY